MSKHFIKNIEIKNFKCFKDFKAEGFGRVNLIGGKNNVGKTAFMEACYISNNKDNINHIITARYASDIFEDLWDDIGKQYIENFLNKKIEEYKDYEIKINTNNTNIFFKSVNKSNKGLYDELYSEIVLNENEGILDNYLNIFDNSIEKFRIVNRQPYCKKDGKFYNLNEFGDGLGKFINFIILLLSQKNSIILIDEIENGIHYTNLDKLWEIILTISKQQNVQVFATTHSKECIESFNRVQKKLEDNDTYYFEMYKNIKLNNIEMRALDFNQLEYELTHQGRYRGE